MSKYRSALINLPERDHAGLELLLSRSTPLQQTFLQAVEDLRFTDSRDSDLIELSEVCDKLKISIQTGRARLRELETVGALSYESATVYLQDTSIGPRLKIYFFNNVVDISKITEATPATKSLVGRSSNANISKQLSEQGIYVPTQYRDSPLNESDSCYAFPVSRDLHDLVAPGSDVVPERRIQITDGTGRTVENFARSSYGVINDSDLATLDVLQQLTINYLHSLPLEMVDNVKSDIRVPVWIEDVIKLRNMKANGKSRLLISLSILRIAWTKYRMQSSGYDALLKDVVKSDIFSLLDSVNFISKRNNSSEVLLSQLQEMAEKLPAEEIEDLIATDFGDELPFVQVILRWNGDYMNSLLANRSLPVINRQAQIAKPMLLATYKVLCHDYFYGIDSKDSMIVSLADLVRNIWKAPENDLRRLSLNFLNAVVDYHRKSHGEPPRLAKFSITMLGITFNMSLKNLKLLRAASNLHSEIEIVFDREEMVKSTGAKYRTDVAAKPRLPNPIDGFMLIQTRPRKRLSSSIVKVFQQLDGYKISKTSVSFLSQGEPVYITKFTKNSTLTTLSDAVGDEYGVPTDSIYVGLLQIRDDKLNCIVDDEDTFRGTAELLEANLEEFSLFLLLDEMALKDIKMNRINELKNRFNGFKMCMELEQL
ncbi:hypothetical protein [Enterovibrio norvegicus]|uniref:hypothetical protein n=1 Tax=Enterovibrio norvegicus TaxID=188144 RepID=UPI000C83D8F8|nr:hypothetical protein [Enterovibrio norvegicus]PMH64518.1 hypothetical protein BCU62_15805 [Enterovibrio norvegicus]